MTDQATVQTTAQQPWRPGPAKHDTLALLAFIFGIVLWPLGIYLSQRPWVRHWYGLVQQLRGPCPQQFQVPGRSNACLGHEPCSLREGQRQVP